MDHLSRVKTEAVNYKNGYSLDNNIFVNYAELQQIKMRLLSGIYNKLRELTRNDDDLLENVLIEIKDIKETGNARGINFNDEEKEKFGNLSNSVKQLNDFFRKAKGRNGGWNPPQENFDSVHILKINNLLYELPNIPSLSEFQRLKSLHQIWSNEFNNVLLQERQARVGYQ